MIVSDVAENRVAKDNRFEALGRKGIPRTILFLTDNGR
jgi:hypothetical protein